MVDSLRARWMIAVVFPLLWNGRLAAPSTPATHRARPCLSEQPPPRPNERAACLLGAPSAFPGSAHHLHPCRHPAAECTSGLRPRWVQMICTTRRCTASQAARKSVWRAFAFDFRVTAVSTWRESQRVGDPPLACARRRTPGSHAEGPELSECHRSHTPSPCRLHARPAQPCGSSTGSPLRPPPARAFPQTARPATRVPCATRAAAPRVSPWVTATRSPRGVKHQLTSADSNSVGDGVGVAQCRGRDAWRDVDWEPRHGDDHNEPPTLQQHEGSRHVQLLTTALLAAHCSCVRGGLSGARTTVRRPGERQWRRGERSKTRRDHQTTCSGGAAG